MSVADDEHRDVQDTVETIVEEGWNLVSRSPSRSDTRLTSGPEDNAPEGDKADLGHRASPEISGSKLTGRSTLKPRSSPFWPSLRKGKVPQNKGPEQSGSVIPKLVLPDSYNDGPNTTSKGAVWRRKLGRQDLSPSDKSREDVSPIRAGTPGGDCQETAQSGTDPPSERLQSANDQQETPALRSGIGRFSLAGRSSWTPSTRPSPQWKAGRFVMSPLNPKPPFMEDHASKAASTAGRSGLQSEAILTTDQTASEYEGKGEVVADPSVKTNGSFKSDAIAPSRDWHSMKQPALHPSRGSKGHAPGQASGRQESSHISHGSVEGLLEGLGLEDQNAPLDFAMSPLNPSIPRKLSSKDVMEVTSKEGEASVGPDPAEPCQPQSVQLEQTPAAWPEQSGSEMATNANEPPEDSKELWVHLKRMGIPISSQLMDYPHLDNEAEMVTKRTFEGWPAAMQKLQSLQDQGYQYTQQPLQVVGHSTGQEPSVARLLAPKPPIKQQEHLFKLKIASPAAFVGPPSSAKRASQHGMAKLQYLIALQKQGEQFAALI